MLWGQNKVPLPDFQYDCQACLARYGNRTHRLLERNGLPDHYTTKVFLHTPGYFRYLILVRVLLITWFLRICVGYFSNPST